MDQQRLTTRVVKPTGPVNATMLLMGEAPGAEENASGRPFQGEAGQLLNRSLNYKKMPRANLRIDNIFNQRPPSNNIGHFFQDKKRTQYTWEAEEHLEKCRQRILEMPNLNVIVAMGDVPLYALTGKKGIWKWRGSVLPCTLAPGKKVYPTFHPSGVQRLINEPTEKLDPKKKGMQQNVLPLFLIDLGRADEQSTYPEIQCPRREFHLCWTFKEAVDALTMLRDESLLAMDIETIPTPMGPVLWMIGFSPSPDKAYVIPFLRNLDVCWTIEEEQVLLRLISEIMLNENKIICQGGLYDLSILGRYYGIRVRRDAYEDTMLAHHASYPYLRKSLATLASIYTWESYYKDEGRGYLGSRTDEGEGRYNCKDTSVTREILPITHRNARELGTYEGYRRTLSVLPSILGMMLRGVKIDMKKKARLAKKFKLIAKKHRIVVQKWVTETYGWPKEINLNSHVQVKNLVYDEMDLPVQLHVKKKTPTSDKEALKKLIKKAKKQQHKLIIGHILEYKKYAKLTSTYTNMQVDSDGRIHTSYGFVSTWRLSSSESPFGNGGNLQNIPAMYRENGKAIRQLFVADPGKIIVCADYSQAESMVVDWEANNLKAMKLYAEKLPGGVHWARAKDLFGIPDDVPYNKKAIYKDSKVTGHETTLYMFRQIGKRAVHAGNYGMGPRMLQAALAQDGFVAPYNVCVKLIKKFQQTSPFTMQWQRKIRETVKATRKLVSSYGRVRYFMGRMNDNLFRAAYAFSPQNTVGEMLTCAIQRIDDNIPEVEILLNNHDEVMMQCNEGIWESVIPKVRECMEEELMINGRSLVIPVDFKIGPSWGDAKEIE